MARQRFIYGGLLLAAVWYSMLYSYRGLRFGIAVMILIPLAGAVQMIYGRCTGRLSMEPEGQAQERGAEGVLHLHYENGGFLPIAAVCVTLEWEAPGEALQVTKHWIREIPGNGTGDQKVTLQAAHCGRAVIRMRRVRIYDYLGLCGINGRDREVRSIYITPVVKNLAIDQAKAAYIGAIGEDRDMMEGYEIRDYRAGDSLHRVHWKLTARTDELQIRDFEGRRTDGAELYLNMHGLDRDEKGAQTWDSYLELAVGLMLALYRSGRLSRVVWFKMGQRDEQEVNREEDIIDCMYRLLALDITQIGGDVMQEESLHLDMDMRVYRGALCVYG